MADADAGADLAAGCLLAAAGPLELLAVLDAADAGTGAALSFCATADETGVVDLAGPADGAETAVTAGFPAPIPIPPKSDTTIGLGFKRRG